MSNIKQEILKLKQEINTLKKNIRELFPTPNCLHDNCPSCRGTGLKEEGTGYVVCLHMIACSCPKCSPRF